MYILSSDSDVGSLMFPTNLVWEGVGDKANGFECRVPNDTELRKGIEHSQHDRTNYYFMTLVDGLAGIRPVTSHSVVWWPTNWANQVVV